MAQKIEKLKTMIVKGRLIKEEEVSSYLQDMRSFIDQVLMESLKK